jgi:sulfatase modifying factor 1
MKQIHNKSLTTLTCAAGLALSSWLAPSSYGLVTIDMVTVGGAFGAVSYTYNISKYEVSNAQYVEFLNKVDATGANTLSLYNASMTSSTRGGINFTTGNPNGSKYSAKTGRGNNPVVFVSFFDSMRFVNWLHNGQTSSGTESGVYTIGTGLSETRAVGATYWLPSEDEWYKAAYYQPLALGGPSDSYWLYPMKTDSVPYSDQPPGTSSPDASKAGNFFRDDGVANGYNDGYAVSGSTSLPSGNPLTDVGAYTTASSYYGTFDQGGNVREWNEAIIGSSRGRSGGSWLNNENGLRASVRASNDPSFEGDVIGFRVAGLIPEPTAGGLILLGGAFLWRRARR